MIIIKGVAIKQIRRASRNQLFKNERMERKYIAMANVNAIDSTPLCIMFVALY